MTLYKPSILLKRLKLFSTKKNILFDQSFHEGVNVICSSTNSCGKSTIMDSIYFLLGGEITEWREAAKNIEFGLLEVSINNAIFSLKRERSEKISPTYIFEGPINDAEKNSTHWSKYGHKRTEKQKSFSQIMFELLGLPELKNEQDDNVTINQVLRLIYCDQETSVNKIFKDVTYDKEAMRKSIIEILLGADDLELFDLRTEVQSLTKQLAESKANISALTTTLTEIYKLDDFNVASFELEASKIEAKIEKLNSEINKCTVSTETSPQNVEVNSELLKTLRTNVIDQRKKLLDVEQKTESLIYEVRDSELFIENLKYRDSSLQVSDKILNLIGSIDYHSCPSCLSPIASAKDESCCKLCKNPIEPDSKNYNRTKARSEIAFQLSESQVLQEKRRLELNDLLANKENLKNSLFALEKQLAQHEPVANKIESELRLKLTEIGYLERTLEDLIKSKQLGVLLERKVQEKSELSALISKVQDRIKFLTSARQDAWNKANQTICKNIKEILQLDLPVEESFRNPNEIEVQFDKNKILVDGNSKFSASSEVILKNALFLSIFKLSLEDQKIKFPRFLLLDNVEDKGMTKERSQNFQKLIVDICSQGQIQNQIIYTTSMVNPDFSGEKYRIGDVYRPDAKTLKL